MIKGKYLLLGAGAVGLVVGGSYLFNLNRLSNELEVVTKAAIHKINISGITLRVDVRLKNPTAGSVTVKHPFVKMLYNGSTFASSEVKDVDYEIPKFGEKVLEPIFINLSFFSLATSVPGLLKEYRSTGKATIEIKTITTINNQFAYSKTDKIPIGNKAQG